MQDKTKLSNDNRFFGVRNHFGNVHICSFVSFTHSLFRSHNDFNFFFTWLLLFLLVVCPLLELLQLLLVLSHYSYGYFYKNPYFSFFFDLLEQLKKAQEKH